MAHLRLATNWTRHPLPRALIISIGLLYGLHPGMIAATKIHPRARTHRVPATRASSRLAPHLFLPPLAHSSHRSWQPHASEWIPIPTSSSTSTTWLAKIVQAEAGDQPFITQLAVAAVVINRTRSGLFPKNILATILQPGQFEPVTNGTFYPAIPCPSAWTAARTILQGGPNPAPSALYFFNPTTTNIPWMFQLIHCVTYGAMRFCEGPSS